MAIRHADRPGFAWLFATCVAAWFFQLAPRPSARAATADPPSPSKPGSSATAPTPASGQSQPVDVEALFRQIDELGRPAVRDAKFVKVTFSFGGRANYERARFAWLLGESNKTVTLLEDDLVPWAYKRRGRTTIPSNWEPAEVTIKRIEDADFPAYCETLSRPEPPADERARARHSLHAPGPSQKFLTAHAAWQRGLARQAVAILATDPKYREDFGAYRQEVLEDLAWLHFLRGVNLLMFADRKQVLKHLMLVSRISPRGKFAAQANELAGHIGRLIAKAEHAPQSTAPPAGDDEPGAAVACSAGRRALRSNAAQPGQIVPWIATDHGQPVLLPPTRLLANMGMKVVPLLIDALGDQTPTRTVYHWRDFARSRQVWRVSDFSWVILREITKRNFGRPPGDRVHVQRDVTRGTAARHCRDQGLVRQEQEPNARRADVWILLQSGSQRLDDRGDLLLEAEKTPGQSLLC